MKNYDRAILFTFAGRRQNMALQLPFIRRILDENPDTEYHIWNLARDPKDAAYLHTITGDRIIVWHDYYGSNPGYPQVYRHYTEEQYHGSVFVKLDDDIVFLQTQHFGAFLDAITAYRGRIMSPNIINNGACTVIEPNLWKQFLALESPLLDAHTDVGFADMAHNYFFDHHEQILAQPIELIPTADWLSINMIGYDSLMAQNIAEAIGLPQPAIIAGRPMRQQGRIYTDESFINTQARMIMRGVTAGHLTFGPQNVPARQAAAWRKRYKEIAAKYLADPSSAAPQVPDALPPLSPTSQGVTTRVAAVSEKFGARDWRTRWINEKETGARR